MVSERREIQGHIFPRERLFSQLLANYEQRVVVLLAGNGYGKTSLLTSFFEQNELHHHWITLTQPMYKFAELIHDLHDLMEENRETWVVFDHFEKALLNEKETTLFIHWIESLPTNVTLVFSGRRIMKGFPISRWKLQKFATVIDYHELAFTDEETRDYLQMYCEHYQKDEYYNHLIEDIEGWPAGLTLFNELEKKRTRNLLSNRSLNRFYSETNLYHYITSEIVDSLSKDIRHFLMYTSLFRELDEHIIQDLNPEWPVRTWIQEIEEMNLFFTKRKGDYFQIQSLFRKYFYKMAEREWGKERIRSIHGEIATLFRKHYQFFKALSQAVVARKDELVIDVIVDMAERYEPTEFFRVFDGYIERLSPTLKLSEISLFLYRAIPLQLSKQLIKPLETLAERYKHESISAYADVTHRLANLYFFNGEFKAGLKFAEISLENSSKISNNSLTALNLSIMAKFYRFMKDVENASLYSRKALIKAEKHGYKHTQMHTLWVAAEHAIDSGEYNKGRKFAEQSILVSKEEECDNASVVYPLCSLSRYYRKIGDLKTAFEVAYQALHHAQQFDIDIDRAWATASVAKCYYASGELKRARHYFEKAMQLCSEYRYVYCLFQAQLIDILQEIGSTADAEQLENKLQETISQSNVFWIHPNTSKQKAAPLRLNMLGALSVEVAGKSIKISRKASRNILLLLASNYERKWSKDELIGLLFPDYSEEVASNHFYVALSILRKQLEPNLKRGRQSSFIVYENAHYYFKLDQVELDVVKLLELLKKPYGKSIVSEAINLYRGDLLHEYPYEDWLFEKRMSVREQYLEALARWAYECEGIGEISEAIRLYEVMLCLESYDEAYHYDYIRLLMENKQTVKATKAAERAIMLMEKELGIDIRPELTPLLNIV